MQGITYTNAVDGITPGQLAGGFFVGWPSPPSPQRHLDLLRGSVAVELALDGATRNVVGFVNAVGDGVVSAYIPLLEVLPAYQGRGIGSELMRRIMESLDIYMIDLACDDDLVPFYERFGMTQANAMCFRNYARQNGEPAAGR
jgi:ribosomal protein S18 acetylase RimI-like enzyme